MNKFIWFIPAIVCILGCSPSSKTVVSPSESSVAQEKKLEQQPSVNEKILEIKIIPPSGTKVLEPLDVPEIKKKENKNISFASFSFDDEPPVDTKTPVEVEVDGKKIKAPPGSEVHLTLKEKQEGSANKNFEKSEAKSKSVGISTDSDSAIGKMNFNAPEANLNKNGGGSASGGDTEYNFNLVTQARNSFLTILGILLLIGGIVVWLWWKQWKLGLGLCVSGLVVITVDILAAKYPWVFLLVFVGLLITAWAIVRDAMSKRNKEITLGVVASAIEDAGEHGTTVKQKISEKANGTTNVIKNEITKVKNKIAKFKSKIV